MIEKLLADNPKAQFVRFALNGCLCAAIHYGVLYALLGLTGNVWLPYIAGYGVSLIVNFYVTSWFTFRRQPSWRRFAGFCASHAINFVAHLLLLRLFLWIGLSQELAPIATMACAAILQFLILRIVFRK